MHSCMYIYIYIADIDTLKPSVTPLALPVSLKIAGAPSLLEVPKLYIAWELSQARLQPRHRFSPDGT